MAERHDIDALIDEQAGISRRQFIQGVMVASAATTALGLPSAVLAAPAASAPPTLLTTPQDGALTTVLNCLIPSDGVMPGAGGLGIATFIDKALIEAPHLRRHIIGIVAMLPDADVLAALPVDELEALLR